MNLLEVHGLSKSFSGFQALDDVSFSLRRGELLALIGPNGAGKSTCFNMLNGQGRPDRGSVVFDGTDLSRLTPPQIWRLGVSRTFQVAATFASMTVAENVQMALLSHRRKLSDLWSRANEYSRTEALELLAQVSMAEQADRACGVLAYGDVKRVELAIALASSPKLLLMDEPTAGMPPRERDQLMALTKKLVVERNISVLFTEHSMDVVFGYADRIIVLARGKVIAEGEVDYIKGHEKVSEVYFGKGSTFDRTTGKPVAA